LWLHSLKVAQLLRSAACLYTNQSRSYLNHLVLVSISRIALNFSNLAAPLTACCSKLGTLLKSQNKFLKHKAFYSDRLRYVGIELYFQYFEVEVDLSLSTCRLLPKIFYDFYSPSDLQGLPC